MVANIVPVSTAGLSLMSSNIADERAAKSMTLANQALGRLVSNSDYIDTMMKYSSTYAPPPSIRVISSLWGLLNPDEKPRLTEKIVERAVLDEGGTYAEARALWEQLNPGKGEDVTAGEFAKNPYLLQALTLIYEPLHEAINETRIKAAMLNPPTTGTLLDFYKGSGGGTLFDFIA